LVELENLAECCNDAVAPGLCRRIRSECWENSATVGWLCANAIVFAAPRICASYEVHLTQCTSGGVAVSFRSVLLRTPVQLEDGELP
jgi:hypothetical protein